jgi:DNA-binding LacI/PurR family transcriptional regulator
MGVTQEAQKQRLHLAFISGEHVESHDADDHPYQFLSHLSGAIIAGQMPSAFLDYVQKIHLPCIFLNYRSSTYPFDTVSSDQIEVGRLQGKHLVELGHTQCLYLSGESDNVAYEDRLAGFMEAFSAGSRRNVVVLKGGKNSESGRMMVQQALEQKVRFTALAAGNDMMAVGAMNELLDRGFRIPEEISVCGIDNVPFAENCRPALTTVHIEKQEMGIKAVRLLLERLKNPAKIQETVLLGIQLCVRQSTGPAANSQRTPGKKRSPNGL